MANSLIVGGIKMGMQVSIACPEGYQPDADIVTWADGATAISPRDRRLSAAAAEGADVRRIRTCGRPWARRARPSKRMKAFQGYQVNDGAYGNGAIRTAWCCIACPHTGVRRSPPKSLKSTPVRSSTRRKTACTRRRPCWCNCWLIGRVRALWRSAIYRAGKWPACFEGVPLWRGRQTRWGNWCLPPAWAVICETLTDPSYSGQIVVQTFPLIGNYGMIPRGLGERAARLCAAMWRAKSAIRPSNFPLRRHGGRAFLRQWGIPGVCGVDTREITRAIREEGALNAAITSDPDAVDFAALRAYRIVDAVKSVSLRRN